MTWLRVQKHRYKLPLDQEDTCMSSGSSYVIFVEESVPLASPPRCIVHGLCEHMKGRWATFNAPGHRSSSARADSEFLEPNQVFFCFRLSAY